MDLKSKRGSRVALALLSLVALSAVQTKLTSASSNNNANHEQDQHETNQHQPRPHQSHNLTTIQTSSGLLRGSLETHAGSGHNAQRSILKFLGVPYALPPTGPRRFRKPSELPEEQASSQVDATQYGKTCPQHRHLARFVSTLLNLDQESFSEDCLHLNLFVPSSSAAAAAQNSTRPVIVFIPGEGYDFADARQYDGSQLALRTQSIVVTVQYRVGVLGLLHAPQLGLDGNMALHDQLAALRWINKNIRQFGGDEQRVTLMGRFTGSMSISALMTAPQQHLIKAPDSSRTLFSRAILTSGIAVNDWIISPDQSQRTGLLVEEALKRGFCSPAQAHNGSECLETMPIEQLLEISGYEWRLVRDDQLVGQAAPIEAIQKGQVAGDLEAVMLGETGAEGTLCLYRHMLMAHLNNYAQLIDEDRLTSEQLYELIRADSATYFKFNLTQSNPIQMALEALMSVERAPPSGNEQTPAHGLRQKYLDACSSYMVKAHNQRFKRQLQARNQLLVSEDKPTIEVHHYELKYKPSFSLAPEYIREAAHGDDIPLIFGLVYNQPRLQVETADLAMTHKMLAYIGNFVHGNHPLLQQHSSAFDESPADFLEASCSHEDDSAATATKRTWASEGQVYALDVEGEPSRPASLGLGLRPAARAAALLKLVIAKGSTGVPAQQQVQPPAVATRSQKLMELHQQTRRQEEEEEEEEELKWMRRRGQQLLRASGTSQTQDKEITSFSKVLLLTASVVIVALMSVCVVLSVLVVRYNVAMQRRENAGVVGGACGIGSGKRSHQNFKGSSSTCNIYDDSQGGSIDAVLNQQASAKKGEHAFCNVFTKLTRNQTGQATQPQPQQASTRTPTSQPTAGQQQQQ